MDSAVALTLLYAVGYYPHCAIKAELLYRKLRTLRGKTVSVEFLGDLFVEELLTADILSLAVPPRFDFIVAFRFCGRVSV